MIKRSAAASLALALAALGIGCQSADEVATQRITAEYVRNHPSPELESMALTSEQIKNEHARNADLAARQIVDDVRMILLLDDPVRLSEYPIP